jgi:hypothetical protein
MSIDDDELDYPYNNVRRRNKSLKMKTPFSSIPLINRVSKISSPSSSTAIEVQRIIIHDGGQTEGNNSFLGHVPT